MRTVRDALQSGMIRRGVSDRLPAGAQKDAPCLPGYKRSLCNEGVRGASIALVHRDGVILVLHLVCQFVPYLPVAG